MSKKVFICGGTQEAFQAANNNQPVVVKTSGCSDVYTPFTGYTQAHSDSFEDLKDNLQRAYEELGGEKQLKFIVQ